MDTETNSVNGVLRNGRVELSPPPGWTEGMKVVVTPAPVHSTTGTGPNRADDPPYGSIREEDWPTTPEGIAELIEQWRKLEPLEFTPEEREEIRAGREWFKQYELKKLREEWGLEE